MSLRVSDLYAHLLDKARWSHAHGRSISHILAADVDAARLFSYGYRSQTIGTFHATRLVLEAQANREGSTHCLADAFALLAQLEAKAIDPILTDHRALISTLYYYDRWTTSVKETLEKTLARDAQPEIQKIRDLFVQAIQRVTAGNGLYVARDVELPEQGAFIVPDLDIAIAPIIYGDFHSWNAAFLAAGRPGVAVHRHHFGAEIHLGFSPVKGETILGDSFAEVGEGYAMPIPPMTDHGFLNTSGGDHVVPFVFGSLKMAGWGVFFDVEARRESLERKRRSLESEAMNDSVFLERAIRRMRDGNGFMREILVPPHRAGSDEIGGLQLALNRVDQDEIEKPSDYYRIVSVQLGEARIQIGEVEAEIGAHDHFGVPANMACSVIPHGEEPFLFLDATMLPIEAWNLKS
jgi:hypothetical protein